MPATRTVPTETGQRRAQPAWQDAPPRITHTMIQRHGSYAAARAALAEGDSRG